MAKKTVRRKPQKAQETTSVYDRWIIGFVYAILIVLPLAISRWSYDQFDLVKLTIFRLLVLAIVFIWLAKMLSANHPVRWSWREALLVGFIVLGVISVLTSIHIPTALHGKYKRYEGLLTFITYISAYLVVLQVFRRKQHFRTLIEIVSVVGGIVSLYGIFQFLGYDPIYWGNVPFEQRRSFSTFGNPDLLAGYLVLAFPLAITAAIQEKKRRWLHLGSASVLFIGLMTALTRSGWLGAIAAIICLAVLLRENVKTHWRQVAVAGAAVVIVLAGLVVYTTSLSGGLSIAGKFKGAFQLNSGTALGRFEIWKAGLLMMKDRPLFGQGPDTYRLASEKYETKRYVTSVQGGTVSDNAHNYPIQLGAGFGPLAMIAIYAFFISWIFRMIRVRNKLPSDSERFMVAGVVAAVVGYLTTMMLGISIVGASSTFWVLMAVAAGFTRDLDVPYKSFSFTKWGQELKLGVALVLVIITVVSAGFAVAMYAGDIYLVQGLVAQPQQGEVVAVKKFNTAAALYPGNGRIMSQLGQGYMRWASGAMSRQDTAAFKQYAEKAIVAFERAEKAEPLEADYKVFLANAHGNLGRYDKALQVLDEVIARRPYSVPGNYLYGQFSERINRKDQAIDHYEVVFSVAPTYMDTSSTLARLHSETGNEGKPAGFKKSGDKQDSSD